MTGMDERSVRDAMRLMDEGAHAECALLVASLMGENPHAPEPHNLMGMLLERAGEKEAALRHYQAACALDPKFLPARRNLARASSGAEVEGGALLSGKGRFSLFEVCVQQSSPAVGRRVWEIDLPESAVIGGIVRGEESIVPRGDTRIYAGDTLIVIAAGERAPRAFERLAAGP